jgi:tRNA modification GTPase
MTNDAHTYVLQLTPLGRAALSSVFVCGPRAAEIIGTLFLPAARRVPDIGRIAFGHWKVKSGEEVVVCRRGEDEFEIHCHGGTAAVTAIVADLVHAGCRPGDADRWLGRFSDDPIARDAYAALTKARTERTAGILLDQLNGALRRELTEIVENLNAGETAAAQQRLGALLERGDVGLHLTRPWQVVIAGRPNVGKSSLINALVGYQRAIVYDQPGTTRDVVTSATAFDGWPVELSDTAGLRATADRLEAAGIGAAERRIAAADLQVLVFDQAAPWTDADQRLVDAWPAALHVCNKCDLPAAGNPVRDPIMTSAVRGTGLPALLREIVKRLVGQWPDEQLPVPFTPEQISAIRSAWDEAAPT